MNLWTDSLASDLEMSQDSPRACEEHFLNEPGQSPRSKPLLLTQSWVSTFFVQLRGAVRCIAWSQRATSINHFNIFELLTLTSHHPSRSRASYLACAPCGSCSCPPGSAFRSRCDRPWCCSCQRSLNPLPSLCSLPREEEDKSAVKHTRVKYYRHISVRKVNIERGYAVYVTLI